MTKPEHYKLFRYFDGDHLPKSEIPTDVNYVTQLSQRLHPVYAWYRGRVEYIRFYANASLDTQGEIVGTDLIIEEHFKYTDVGGFARQRVQTISWFREDGSAGDAKTRVKLYNNTEGRTEGRRRRRNVIDQMSIRVVGVVAATETAGDIAAAVALTTPYIEDLETEVQQYIEASSSNLSTAIASDTGHSWLDNPLAPGVTVRMFILGELV